MENIKQAKYNFDSFDLIAFIKQKFKILFIICIVAAIVSAVVALLIENKFKSTVILFPTSSGSVSKALMTDNASSKGILVFGEEEEVEQMQQVLQSDEIRDRIVTKYNLRKHYEIQDNSEFPMTELANTYNSNINIRRTEFMSVEINVLDKDPQIAANIANDIASYLDTVMNRMQKDRARMALEVVEREYSDLIHQISILEDSLVRLREYGIYDYESQAEVYSDAYAQAVAKQNVSGAKLLEEKLQVLAKYGGAYISIRDFLEHEKKQLSAIKSKYAEAKVDATQNLPHKFIVNSAAVAERKSYPVRWLIVVVSTGAAGFLALIALIIIDIFRKK